MSVFPAGGRRGESVWFKAWSTWEVVIEVSTCQPTLFSGKDIGDKGRRITALASTVLSDSP